MYIALKASTLLMDFAQQHSTIAAIRAVLILPLTPIHRMIDSALVATFLWSQRGQSAGEIRLGVFARRSASQDKSSIK